MAFASMSSATLRQKLLRQAKPKAHTFDIAFVLRTLGEVPFEYGIAVFLADADTGILDGNLQHDIVIGTQRTNRRQVVKAHRQGDPTHFGKLDRIRKQVVDNLDNAVLVAPQTRRNIWIAVNVEGQALSLRLRFVLVIAFLQNRKHIVFHRFDAQTARLNFRNIQDIVHQ